MTPPPMTITITSMVPIFGAMAGTVAVAMVGMMRNLVVVIVLRMGNG